MIFRGKTDECMRFKHQKGSGVAYDLKKTIYQGHGIEFAYLIWFIFYFSKVTILNRWESYMYI